MGTVRDYSEYRFGDIQRNLRRARFSPLDVMVTGVTGAGKSTTLNTFFRRIVAPVGYGADPETMEVSNVLLNDCFRLWDTPGLGDGVERDKVHKRKIAELLRRSWQADGFTYGFIDMAVVIIDGRSRDLGTTYDLLNTTIVPNIQKDRIFVAINQADAAKSGRHWDPVTRQPDDVLLRFLRDQAAEIQQRVQEATGVDIYLPVCYSAEYDYNVDKLLDFIIDHMPRERRQIS